jgi:hypothetical protein
MPAEIKDSTNSGKRRRFRRDPVLENQVALSRATYRIQRRRYCGGYRLFATRHHIVQMPLVSPVKIVEMLMLESMVLDLS